jgi:hypothetical protein
VRDRVEELAGAQVPLGDIDISFYRDDVGLRGSGRHPVVHESRIEFPVDGTTVVLVDDVLYTGRTVRAALDECSDFGRPRRILLCVLIDRGGRELPIQADVVHCHTVLSGALQRGEQPATHWRKCPKHCGRQLKQGHGCASDNTPGDPSDRYGKCGGNQAGCEREREGGAQGAQEEADCPDPGQA